MLKTVDVKKICDGVTKSNYQRGFGVFWGLAIFCANLRPIY